ncbi:hypothetical protein LPJ66_010127 [Kickxella alabastrina]|uniref:Uncharacterized protein n=1 Tax=Kickxella alabastrina TaxID=61397 RepID=A0ACC1I1K7_9FUNG|nr:hypothetical protein LPJ66_010127 [Kickxella alabastrina]
MDHPISFFSLPDAAPAQRPQPTDSFLAAHIHVPSEVQQQTQAQVQQAQVQQDHKNKGKDNDHPKPAPMPKSKPIADASVDQIHPLIRNRRLETPEEIAAWIAERKAKYPTEANIRRKTQEQEQTQEPAKQPNKRKHEDTSANPLASLLSAYASSQEEEEEEASDSGSDAPEMAPAKLYAPKQTPFRPSTIAPEADRRSLRVCKYFTMGRCTKGPRCPFLHPESIQKKQQQQQQQQAQNEPDEGPALKSSLLQMLLAKDIARENYRVLQCIEYICDKSFLGVPVEYALLYQ